MEQINKYTLIRTIKILMFNIQYIIKLVMLFFVSFLLVIYIQDTKGDFSGFLAGIGLIIFIPLYIPDSGFIKGFKVAISMGDTRKNFYKNYMVLIIFISIIFSVITCLQVMALISHKEFNYSGFSISKNINGYTMLLILNFIYMFFIDSFIKLINISTITIKFLQKYGEKFLSIMVFILIFSRTSVVENIAKKIFLPVINFISINPIQKILVLVLVSILFSFINYKLLLKAEI
ncbi:hypothetical protein [Clostridium rectalis]|uniref:hypothetical protein n=1 Tax=Clostridium rectalis TaxID=2040295 RepID=UPI000F63BE8E|nr:hypothetical protein [Clostridium rectalis]